jgi:hypothetical protein
MALEKKNRVVTIDFDCKQNSSLLPILLPKSTPKVFFFIGKMCHTVFELHGMEQYSGSLAMLYCMMAMLKATMNINVLFYFNRLF